MIFNHKVKANGKWYNAGEDVPMSSPTVVSEPVKVETEPQPKANDEKAATKPRKSRKTTDKE